MDINRHMNMVNLEGKQENLIVVKFLNNQLLFKIILVDQERKGYGV